MKEEFKKRAREIEKETNEEIKKLGIKNKEQKELIVDEIRLKTKARLNALRDEENSEISKEDERNKAIIEKIKTISSLSLLSEEEYLKLVDFGIDSLVKVGMGAEALLEVLKTVDLAKL